MTATAIKPIKFLDGPLQGETRNIKPALIFGDEIYFMQQVKCETEGKITCECIWYERKKDDEFSENEDKKHGSEMKIPKGKVPASMGQWKPYHPGETILSDRWWKDAPKDDVSPAEAE